MSLDRLLAVTRKEFHHITRDVRTFFLMTIAPAFALFLLAQVFSTDIDHFNLIVMDEDKTDLSRRYVADLTDDGTFHLIDYVTSYEEIDARLQTTQANLALVIPRDTAAKLRANRPAPVQAVVDGVDARADSQALGQLEGRSAAFALARLPAVSGHPRGTLDLRLLAWYNPSLRSLYSMVPGLFAVVMSIPALALALALAREKELGSFEGLAATPIRGLEYLVGKMLAYAGLGLASTGPVMFVATVLFQVPFRGSLILFAAMVLLYYLASFGIALVVAGAVRSQQTAMMITILVFFVPTFFLAGLTTPVNTSSQVSFAVSRILPATHLIAICRGIFLKGLGLSGLLSPTLALLAIGGAMLALGLARFGKWID